MNKIALQHTNKLTQPSRQLDYWRAWWQLADDRVTMKCYSVDQYNPSADQSMTSQIPNPVDIAITGVARKAAETLGSFVVNLAKDQLDKWKVKLDVGLNTYARRTYAKCSKLKTLLYRYEPAHLLKCYVHARFNLAKEKLQDRDLLQQATKGRRFLITGTAGSGKSVFMKYSTLHLLGRKEDGYFPLFLELRNLNSEPSSSIVGYIAKEVADIIGGFSTKQLEYGLRTGRFFLILDGLDEVNYTRIESVEKEILELSHKYGACGLLVSARPNQRYDSWQDFSTAHVQPFDKGEVITLIDHLEFDNVIKQRFIEKIDKDLYQTHQDFLSNPLLATMMLLTFDQFAEIPSKIHIFYEQAFVTLFSKHDALKSTFVRQSYSGLAIDDFRRAFSGFSFLSYADERFQFSERELIEYIDKALELEQITAKSRDIILDLLQSVCLLVKDGDVVTFAHRSFQEYFSAVFIAHSQILDTVNTLDTLIKSRDADNVITLLWEIDREFLETRFIMPLLNKFVKTLNSIDAMKRPSVAYNTLYLALILDINHKTGRGKISNLIRSGKDCRFFYAIQDLLYDRYRDAYFMSGTGRMLSDEHDLTLLSNARVVDLKRHGLEGPLKPARSGESSDRLDRIELEITSADDEWLRGSWFPEYFVWYRGQAKKLLADLEEQYSKRKEMLSKIVMRMAGSSGRTKRAARRGQRGRNA